VGNTYRHKQGIWQDKAHIFKAQKLDCTMNYKFNTEKIYNIKINMHQITVIRDYVGMTKQKNGNMDDRMIRKNLQGYNKR
jgi:hypothetical protein